MRPIYPSPMKTESKAVLLDGGADMPSTTYDDKLTSLNPLAALF